MALIRRCLACSTVLYLGVAVASDKVPTSEQLHRLLVPLQTFSARFEQAASDDSGFAQEHSYGIFQFSRPASMRWVVERPFKQQIVTDGRQLWIYDEELDQVIVEDFDGQLAVTPALILSGSLSEIETAFSVTEADGGDSKRNFTLVAKSHSELLDEITLTFSEHQLVAISVKSQDQINTITFSDVQVNKSIRDPSFSLKIPEGVDMIYNSQ